METGTGQLRKMCSAAIASAGWLARDTGAVMLHGTTLGALHFQMCDLASYDENFGIWKSNNRPEVSTVQPSRDEQYGWPIVVRGGPTEYTKQTHAGSKQTDNLQIGKFICFSGACILDVKGIMLPKYFEQRQRQEQDLSDITFEELKLTVVGDIKLTKTSKVPKNWQYISKVLYC